MRYTELNPDIRTIPPEEVWAGVIDAERPYIALASRLGDDETPVIVIRLGSVEARAMASELIRLAAELEAPNN
jgi:hypothetical protein